jgi:serine/threonine-protein kinase
LTEIAVERFEMSEQEPAKAVEAIARVLANRPYRAVRLLGRGGAGEVWVVQNTRIGKQFALKVLHAKLVDDRFFVERFALEARAMASLKHPNITSISDYWVADDGRHCLLMQLLQGRTLAQELQARTRLPVSEVAQYGCEALDALVAAHAKGLIHRDIKPENLYLHETQNAGVQLKLLDFGLARVLSLDSDSARFRPQTATKTGVAIGSYRYVSPEVLRGQPADVRSDIYSLGVVLYLSLLSVYNDFDFATRAEFTPPSKQVEGCTPELDAIILRAVELKPEARFQSAKEFLAALLPHRPLAKLSRFNLPRQALLHSKDGSR